MKLLDYLTQKLPKQISTPPFIDSNDRATDKLFKPFLCIDGNNGKAAASIVSAMPIFGKMSLSNSDIGSSSYSTIWKNDVKNYRSRISSMSTEIDVAQLHVASTS